MLLSSSKLSFLSVSVLGLSCLVSTAVLAADSGTTKRMHVVTTTKLSNAALKNLDCGPVIYDYGSTKETKTVCAGPWTAPTGSAESGPSGAASSTSQ